MRYPDSSWRLLLLLLRWHQQVIKAQATTEGLIILAREDRQIQAGLAMTIMIAAAVGILKVEEVTTVGIVAVGTVAVTAAVGTVAVTAAVGIVVVAGTVVVTAGAGKERFQCI